MSYSEGLQVKISQLEMSEGLLRSTLGSTKVLLKSCETALEERDAQLTEARRLLDDARALVSDSCPFVPQWATVLQKRYASFLADSAAPVPAQPAAVPEAVAKDASLSGKEFDALLILLMCSDPWPVGDEANENTMKALATRVAKQYGHDDWIAAYHNHAPTDAALLSAADTEVKNG